MYTYMKNYLFLYRTYQVKLNIQKFALKHNYLFLL